MRKDMGSKKTCKERGEWAELCFMARAADRGLNVSRPHGDSASYDVGVEQNGRFLRIQVKSTSAIRGDRTDQILLGPSMRAILAENWISLPCTWCRSMCGTSSRLMLWREVIR